MPQTPSSPAPAPAAPDVRRLSLTQLHRLAGQGSRRAHAELERRMRAAGAPAPAAPRPAPQPARPAMPAPPAQALRPRQDVLPAADGPMAADRAALVDQWALIERQQIERSRADGPPRLVGLVLIAWGVLLGLGGLALLARSGSAYYLLCGLAAAAVGALLMRLSRWAAPLHGVLIVLMLAWAWRSGNGVQALLQAAPLWLAAAWFAVPAVREPLR
ncbi:MAG: hypothetical protein U1F38_09690 [Ottowia sp.]|nr:hypothetical protein [Ottowia sp.]